MKPTYAELLEVIRRIGYEPFGPSDASDRDILRDIETLAKHTVARYDASLPIDLHTGDVYAKQPHTGPTLPTLSQEALAVLKPPLRFDGGDIVNADGVIIFKCCILTTPSVPRWVDYDIAMFATPLLNAALLPAQPAPLLLDPDNNTEAGQLDALLAEQDSEGVTVAERIERR